MEHIEGSMTMPTTPDRRSTFRDPIALLIPLLLLIAGIPGLTSCNAESGVEVAEGRVVSFDWDLPHGITRVNVETADGQILQADVPEDLQRELARLLMPEGGVEEGEDRVAIQRASSEDPWEFVSMIEPSNGP